MEFLNFLAQYRTPLADLFFQGVTYLAQEFFVIAVICWLYWCSDKKLAYTLGFAYFTSGLLVQALKITFRIPRPWLLDPDFQAVPSALPGATGYSFPSGHTQSVTSLFGILGLHAKKASRQTLCFAVILLVGFSRMYLGCHTPKDVLTSFALSILCSLLCYRLFYQKETAAGREGQICLVMLAVSAALCVYAAFLCQSGAIDLSYAQDCLKAGGAGTAFALGYYIEQKYIRFSPAKGAKKKALRLCIGLAGALLIQTGLKPLIGESLPASFVRYFLVVAWAIVLYPMLFTRAAGQTKSDVRK